MTGEARHRDVEHRLHALGGEAGHDISGHAGGDGGADLAGIAVVGEQHDRASGVAAGGDDMLQRVARLTLGVHDDQVGADLRQPVGQVHVGRQHRDDVVAVLEQRDAQGARTFLLFLRGVLVDRARIRRHGFGRNDHDPKDSGLGHGGAEQHSHPHCAGASTMASATTSATAKARPVRIRRRVAAGPGTPRSATGANAPADSDAPPRRAGSTPRRAHRAA